MIAHDDALVTLHHGDCVEVMRELPADSVDAIVTDPPYGIGFMGKGWDSLDVGPVEASWSGRGRNHGVDVSPKAGGGDWGRSGVAYKMPNPRCGTCGRTINGRDTAKGYKVCHCPEPVLVPLANRDAQRSQAWHEAWAREAFRVAKPGAHLLAFGGTRTYHRLASAIEDAGWEIRDCLVWAYASGFPKSLNIGNGMGTALKPAWEPIVMARKPLRGTVAGNVQQYGTGALNIGATRIPHNGELQPGVWKTNAGEFGQRDGWNQHANKDHWYDPTGGRWPANLLLTDPIFDGDTPGVVGGNDSQAESGLSARTARGTSFPLGESSFVAAPPATYSRFFLVPKSSRSDREPLVRGGLEPQVVNITEGHGRGPINTSKGGDGIRVNRARENLHPTVKPLDLMRHLVRLVTPPGGTVLDCFLGSGTTAIAANAEGFRCIGIEREREYLDIALARMAHQPLGLGLAL